MIYVNYFCFVVILCVVVGGADSKLNGDEGDKSKDNIPKVTYYSMSLQLSNIFMKTCTNLILLVSIILLMIFILFYFIICRSFYVRSTGTL